MITDFSVHCSSLEAMVRVALPQSPREIVTMPEDAFLLCLHDVPMSEPCDECAQLAGATV